MLRVDHLTKSYKVGKGRHYVFKDVSITFPENANIGIIGPNGAGKSTLLRILGGIDYPDKGQIVSDHTFSWPLGLRGGFVSHLSGRDNCRMICQLYGVPHKLMRSKLDYIKELTQIEEYFEEPVKYYSSGMSSRLGFGLSMAFEFDYFLIDEITAVGDAKFKQLAKSTLEEKAKRSRVIMVSHGMSDIRAFCDVGVLVKDGQIQVFEDLDDAIEAYLPKTKEDPEAKKMLERRILLEDIGLETEEEESMARVKKQIAQYLEGIGEKLTEENCQIDGDPADFFQRLGILYKRLNHTQESIRCFKKSLDFNSFQIYPRIQLAAYYSLNGMHGEADRMLDETTKIDANHADLNVELTKRYLREQKIDLAEKHQLKAIHAKPKNANNWFLLSRVYLAADNIDKALDSIIKAIELNKTRPPYYRILSEVLHRMGASLPALDAQKRENEAANIQKSKNTDDGGKIFKQILGQIEKLDSRLN